MQSLLLNPISMKKIALITSLFCFLFVANSLAQRSADEERRAQTEFNERQLDKYLKTHTEKLNLSRRQGRQIKSVERRYVRKEKQLQKQKGWKWTQRRQLQKQKNEELLELLTNEQIEQLNALVGRKRFFQRLLDSTSN